MINTHSQTVDGMLGVGRSLSVGGGVLVQGGATINHDLNVRGRIVARDVQGNNKGLFSSADSLMEAFKKPLPGWYAYVDTGSGIKVYVVEEGAWVESHTSSLLDYVDLTDLKARMTTMEQNHAHDISELSDSIDTEASAREAADTTLDGKITAEKTARESAVTTLTDALAEETSTRQSADMQLLSALNTAMTQEIQARQEDVRVINEALEDLGHSVWPLDIVLSTNFDLSEYTGQPVTLEITRKVRRRGSLVDADDVESVTTFLTYNGTTETADSASQPDKTITRNINTYGVTKVKVTAVACGMEKSVEKDVRLELPCYFGFAAAANVSDLNITSLNKQSIKTSPSGSYSLNNGTTGNYMWLCVPSRMSISKVASSGFDVPMNAVVTKNPGLGEYKCYRSASAINSGTIKITIS